MRRPCGKFFPLTRKSSIKEISQHTWFAQTKRSSYNLILQNPSLAKPRIKSTWLYHTTWHAFATKFGSYRDIQCNGASLWVTWRFCHFRLLFSSRYCCSRKFPWQPHLVFRTRKGYFCLFNCPPLSLSAPSQTGSAACPKSRPYKAGQ